MSEFKEIHVGSHIKLTSGFPFASANFSNEGFPLIRIRDVLTSRTETYFQGYFPPGYVIKSGNILVGMDGDFHVVRWSGCDALLNQRVLKIDVLDESVVVLDYLYHWLGPFIKKINDVTAATTVKHLSTKDLTKAKAKFPSVATQRRIAAILTNIDTAIEKTEALIAKYQQIKAGLMHDLFTRGITADGKLRPPREQAPELYQETPLGWIPKEWAYSSVESLLERIIDYRGKTPQKTEDGIPLITAKNVRMGYIDPEPREFIAARDYPTWMTRGIPVHTDVVFTTEAPLGNVAQIGTNEKVAFAQRVIILQSGLRVFPNFLRLLLMTESFQRSALRLSSGSTALGIKQSEFRKIMVGHPVRLDEQKFISDKLITLENYEAAEADKVEKLREQKRGLMSDLLIRKVRVLQ